MILARDLIGSGVITTLTIRNLTYARVLGFTSLYVAFGNFSLDLILKSNYYSPFAVTFALILGILPCLWAPCF